MNMTYTTQMNAARQGIITKEMEAVAAKEQMDVQKLRQLVAEGKVAIPANKLHTCLEANGIGSMLKTKINVNLGTSRDWKDLDMELEKVNDAVKMGAESIMDLSSFGDTQKFRRKLTSECPAIIGTVPIYDAFVYYHKPLKEITSEEWINIVEMHAKDGVDFMTIHVGINKNTAKRFKENKRLTNIVSSGGSIIFAWMEMTGQENPFYEHYDRILDICQQYDVTMSLGDACRPGCLADAGDISQIEELVTLGELTKRAWEKDVQVIIEGPGHMPLNQIEANMKIQQTVCQGAPFYVLGPLVTDIAPGYDHITAAIGGAIAATYGASFLCYVTPAEHLRLPDVNDVKEGIIASKIAAHAADIAKGIKGAADWDYEMSTARKNLDWEEMFRLCIDPEKVHRMLLSWLKFYRYLFPVRACVRGYSRVSDPFSYGHLQFKNRIGLSAGFDKNAEAFDELADFGFGFLEVGTVTPDSQSGNPSPRIFRLVDDESLISRTGFNNCGVDAVRQHIRKYRKHSYVLGVNINKNPLSTGDQIVKDFESTFIHLYDCVDYFTLNWGSIDNDLFAMVLEKLTIFRQAANKRCNIFIKLPADIDEKALDTVISLAYKYSIEGFIATGPTMDRSGLHQAETKQLEKIGNGGVSGRGIGKKSQEVVRYLSEHTDRHFLIIGAGGIMTAEDAAGMISQGADMIQIYSAFIYSGPSIVHKLGNKLKNELK